VAFEAFVAAGIGFASGVLSGAFGIGGGIVTTPAIRLIIGAPALIAVGTPLPVIIPTALTGALAYRRRGLVDMSAGFTIAAWGLPAVVLGAIAAGAVGGSVVLLGTSLLITWAAIDMLIQALLPPATASPDDERSDEYRTRRRPGLLAATGLLVGLYSGFFGLGGGFVIVPMLTRWLRFPVKHAIGTSLVAVTGLAVPGTIAHASLGHVDWMLAAAITIGVVPGALIGAHLTSKTSDRDVRIGFAILLVATAIWLAAVETMALS
jgi:hypothetical protein